MHTVDILIFADSVKQINSSEYFFCSCEDIVDVTLYENDATSTTRFNETCLNLAVTKVNHTHFCNVPKRRNYVLFVTSHKYYMY